MPRYYTLSLWHGLSERDADERARLAREEYPNRRKLGVQIRRATRFVRFDGHRLAVYLVVVRQKAAAANWGV